LKRIRIATLLLPPLGLIFLWRSLDVGVGRKIVGSIGTLLYSVVYLALIVLLLMTAAGLEVEWRGGFPPVWTFHKTSPDYDAVEAHRAGQADRSSARPSVAAPAFGTYWTDFRGPRRDGHYAELQILTNWPADGLRKLWKQPVGGGYASFVIAQGRAFTIEQRRDHEAVIAYDFATGRELWAHSYPAVFSESMGGEGPRATPTFHEGRIYSMGALGEFCCLDANTGKLLWRHNILDVSRATCLYFGMSASPLIVGDTVIALSGDPLPPMKGITNYTVVASHKVTGEQIWSRVNKKLAYVSPMLATLAGEGQLLVVAADGVLGLKPENGAMLWEIPWSVQYENSITQPVVVGTNRFVISGGYGAGCMLVEVNRNDGVFNARQIWKNQNLKTKFNSAVYSRGFIYGLDEGILTCLDAATGRRKWKDGRYGYGQLLLASGHLVVISGDGELILVRANSEQHEEVARFPAIQGKTWNPPAIADGRLLVRNAVEMACFDIGLP
jgi:outer membrane protein assembly factor BamB